MTYSESARGQRVSRVRALAELAARRLGDAAGAAGFDAGARPGRDGLYDARAVLLWLGY